jgi:ATP-binding protein involved in chromosome partitioning
MFLKVNIPVLGIVENMAMHLCSQCGHVEHIFGQGGGDRVASHYNTKLLGSLPLDYSIREQGDLGVPAALTFKHQPIGRQYTKVACAVIDELMAVDQHNGPSIVFD